MTETIEGTAVDVTEDRALTVVEPRVVRLAETSTPAAMIEMASEMATALKDIVERQKLYAIIQGKKFPQVEAWMTIARMDNVVAREASRPIRHDDGSYEADVELIRLADGMVIGHGSALCGSPGDRPWDSRAEPARRSMAVTRATSRAFRQQYSWIMALAGYEPTPAEEMPRDEDPPAAAPSRPAPTDDGSLVGIAEKGKGQADFELRQTPDGMKVEFRLTSGRGGIKVVALGDLAEALAAIRDSVIGQRVSCWGHVKDESFRPKGATKDVTYQVLTLSRIQTPDVTLPAVSVDPGATSVDEDDIEAAAALAFGNEAESEPLGLVG